MLSSSAVSVHTFQGIDPFHTFVMDTRWNSFPTTSYMRAAPPNPLSPPQHTSEKPLIARNVPPLYVHSSPSSPSANCTPSADATITRTRSTSCFCLSDEEALTTVDSHHRHLPYCHARLAIPLSDETCRIVLNPYAHISIRSPSKDSSALSSLQRWIQRPGSSLHLCPLGLTVEMATGTYFSAVESTSWLIPRWLFLDFPFEVVSAHADPAVELRWLSTQVESSAT